jgi:sulfotransferase family protein
MRMRVWLASFPRSGNTFARFVLKEVYGIASDTVYPNDAGGKLARFLAETAGEQPSDGPWFTKTHEITAADESSPAVYLVRDGRDAYVSYAHFARLTDPAGHAAMSFDEVLRMLVRSPDHFGGWSRHVDTWTQRARTSVVFYEDLLTDGRRRDRACLH